MWRAPARGPSFLAQTLLRICRALGTGPGEQTFADFKHTLCRASSSATYFGLRVEMAVEGLTSLLLCVTGYAMLRMPFVEAVLLAS